MINMEKKVLKQMNKVEVQEELILILIIWDLKIYLINSSEEGDMVEEQNLHLIWVEVEEKGDNPQDLMDLKIFLVDLDLEVDKEDINKEEEEIMA